MIIKSYEESVNLKEILCFNFSVLWCHLAFPILIENYEIPSDPLQILVFTLCCPLAFQNAIKSTAALK
jgi:hypothetical protein